MADGEGGYQTVADDEYDVSYEGEDDMIDYEDDGREKFDHGYTLRDWPYALGFIFQILTVCIASTIMTTHHYYVKDVSVGYFDWEQRIEMMEMVIVACLIALFTAVMWLMASNVMGASSLHLVLNLGVFTNGVVCVLFAVYGTLWATLAMFAVLGLTFAYSVTAKKRLAFSAALVKLVLRVLAESPFTVAIALCAAFVQALFLIIWTYLAVAGVFMRGHVATTLQIVGMVVSIVWTSEVLKNLVHTTVAGSVATWYFMHESGMPLNPTALSFKRAFTTSFGSVCLGSTLMAPCRVFRAVVDAARNSNNGLATAFASCAMGLLDNITSYFNIYAFTQVAIYGKPFLKSGSDVWELIRARGVDLLIGQNRIGAVAATASYVSGVSAALCGGLWAAQDDTMSVPAVVGVCFLVGFTINQVVLEVLESAAAAILVCYADEPEVLSRVDPMLFNLVREGCSSASFV